MMRWEAADCENTPVLFDDRSDELLRRALDPPKRFARIWIETQDSFTSGEDELGLIVDATDDGGGEAPSSMHSIMLPLQISSFSIQGKDRRFTIVITIHNDEILMNDRVRTESMEADKWTRTLKPLEITGHAVARNH